MSRKQVSELKPFLSIMIIIATLLSVVFCKMEVRRVGYSLLKEVREYKSMQDQYRMHAIEFARYTSPARLRQLVANKLTLSEPRIGQVIQISGNKIALRQ